MNYLHTVRHPRDLEPVALLMDRLSVTQHQVTELRIWVSAPKDRWIEIDCICGSVSRSGGSRDYLDLIESAWTSSCGSTAAVVA